MPQSSSAEPAKSSGRKGTRNVSTLTPSQLARKRANDRIAQRAIRARTREHIERLERELEELRSHQNRDKTVQELLRRNKALENDLRHLQENIGVSITSSPYSAPAGTGDDSRAGMISPSVYEDNLSAGNNGAISSPQMSPLPSGVNYAHPMDSSQQQYVLPGDFEFWASALHNITIPSSVPSPSSSVSMDKYGTTPTSMAAINAPHVGCKDDKVKFKDISLGAAEGCM